MARHLGAEVHVTSRDRDKGDAAVALGAPQREVSFCVPSGNFGDAFAGYVAQRMGLPIRRIVVATNANDIPLPDFRYTRWAASAFGPIIRNRTFFTYGYESIPEARPRNNGVPSVPTEKMRSGDFSELLALGPQYQLYNPFSARLNANGRVQRDPFPGNLIPRVTVRGSGGSTAQCASVCEGTATVEVNAAWERGFLKFDPARYGIVRAPVVEGTIVSGGAVNAWGDAPVRFPGLFCVERPAVEERDAAGDAVDGRRPDVEPEPGERRCLACHRGRAAQLPRDRPEVDAPHHVRAEHRAGAKAGPRQGHRHGPERVPL